MAVALLEAKNLKKYFSVTKGLILAKVVGHVKAVDEINFQIFPGDVFGLVGESGCGKTTTAKCILLLERITSGQILAEGQDISKLQGAGLKHYRGMVQAVFQDPFSSLNPRMRVGSIVAEPIVVNDALPKAAVRERVEHVMETVGLDREKATLYPHEFSGGQRQRIAVARALALNPRLIILDEPVSALDVSIRAQVMNLLKDLREQFNLTYLLIAHNLATVRYMSSWVAVMYLGKIVESSPCEELFTHPLHPYAQALMQAALPSHPSRRREEVPLTGEVPSPLNPPSGCRFHPRCPRAFAPCPQIEPQLLAPGGENHRVACHLHNPF